MSTWKNSNLGRSIEKVERSQRKLEGSLIKLDLETKVIRDSTDAKKRMQVQTSHQKTHSYSNFNRSPSDFPGELDYKFIDYDDEESHKERSSFTMSSSSKVGSELQYSFRLEDDLYPPPPIPQRPPSRKLLADKDLVVPRQRTAYIPLASDKGAFRGIGSRSKERSLGDLPSPEFSTITGQRSVLATGGQPYRHQHSKSQLVVQGGHPEDLSMDYSPNPSRRNPGHLKDSLFLVTDSHAHGGGSRAHANPLVQRTQNNISVSGVYAASAVAVNRSNPSSAHRGQIMGPQTRLIPAFAQTSSSLVPPAQIQQRARDPTANSAGVVGRLGSSLSGIRGDDLPGSKNDRKWISLSSSTAEHRNTVRGIAVLQHAVVSASMDHCLKVWGWSGSLLQRNSASTVKDSSQLTCLGQFDTSGFAVGNRDGFIKIYRDDPSENSIVRKPSGMAFISSASHRYRAHQACTRFIGAYCKEKLVSVGDDHKISLFDLESLRVESSKETPHGVVDVCFEQQDSWNPVACKEGLMILTDCRGHVTLHTQGDLKKVISPEGLSHLTPSLGFQHPAADAANAICAAWVDSRQFVAGFDCGAVALYDVRNMTRGVPVATCELKKDDKPKKISLLSQRFGSPLCVLGKAVSFLSKDLRFLESVEIVSVGDSGPAENLCCLAEDTTRDSLLVAGSGQKIHLLKPRAKL